jgi:hypothetical protein
MKKSIVCALAFMAFSTFAQAQGYAQILLEHDVASLDNQEAASVQHLKAQKLQKQTVNKKATSEAAANQFYLDFEDVRIIKAEKANYFDEFTFIKGTETITAFYDSNAHLVGTSSEKTFDDLPTKAQTYIAENYAHYVVNKVVMFEDNVQNQKNMVLYNRDFEDADNYFVELQRGKEKIVVKVTPEGEVDYFADIQ